MIRRCIIGSDGLTAAPMTWIISSSTRPTATDKFTAAELVWDWAASRKRRSERRKPDAL